jgi:hypothetical protein
MPSCGCLPQVKGARRHVRCGGWKAESISARVARFGYRWPVTAPSCVVPRNRGLCLRTSLHAPPSTASMSFRWAYSTGYLLLRQGESVACSEDPYATVHEAAKGSQVSQMPLLDPLYLLRGQVPALMSNGPSPVVYVSLHPLVFASLPPPSFLSFGVLLYLLGGFLHEPFVEPHCVLLPTRGLPPRTHLPLVRGRDAFDQSESHIIPFFGLALSPS